MKKVICTDLGGILRIIPYYMPIKTESIDQTMSTLCKGEHQHYLFLAFQAMNYLFDLPRVYEYGSYENRCWTFGETKPDIPAICFFMELLEINHTTATGNLTLLDYHSSILDVHAYETRPPAAREGHVRYLTDYYTNKPLQCELIDVVRYCRERSWRY